MTANLVGLHKKYILQNNVIFRGKNHTNSISIDWCYNTFLYRMIHKSPKRNSVSIYVGRGEGVGETGLKLLQVVSLHLKTHTDKTLHKQCGQNG
jgi:hypothetical protein